jgi:radical SAM superfamily enzyme YgiQ (UPF0313 family)
MIFLNPYAGVNKDIPNVGLAYAATHFRTRVIDQNTMPEPRDRFLDFKSDILGISVQSRTFKESIRAAKLYKSKYPSAKVKSVSGFLDIQCCYPYLDFKDKISYRKPFSDNYPFPDYELFDSFEIFQENWRKGVWGYPLVSSHGCPYECTYCASRLRKWQARSPENCLAELRRAKKRWGIKSFLILDDCFNVSKKRVIKFCELVAELRLNWSCSNGLRADRFDEEIARAMAAAGCTHISFGIESISPRVLEAVRKGEQVEDIERAVTIAKKYFKSVNGFFIIGLPGSSFKNDLESLKWALKHRINAHFSYYVPFDKSEFKDSLFYGEKARPVSDVYPKELQAKIYSLTEWLRSSSALKKRFGRLAISLSLKRLERKLSEAE